MEKKARSVVEAIFDQYRINKYLTMYMREPSITSSSEPREYQTHSLSDPTATTVIDHVDEMQDRLQHCLAVEAAVEKLPDIEKDLITRRYMINNSPYVTDETVYRRMGISAPTYRKVRAEAMIKLYLELGGLA